MILLLPHAVTAQSGMAWGRTFLATFPPISGSAPNEVSDLRLVVHALEAATVTVTSSASGNSATIAVLPGSGATVDLDRVFGADLDLRPLEQRSRKSFYIESTASVTIAALSTRSLSADAMLLLPLERLGNRYVVLSTTNGAVKEADASLRYDMPSQFAIIAAHDGTIVTISPSYAGATSVSVQLDRHDVYLVEAPLGEPADVSGTLIDASRPVAVFAGVRRASVPTSIGNFRDYLVEQLRPLDVWAMEAVAVPLFRAAEDATDTSHLRVISAEPGAIFVNGDSTLMAPRIVVDLPLSEPLHLRASIPFEAALFERSGGYDDDGNTLLGDPSMMLIVPTSQFDTSYRFESFDHEELLLHYITIVASAGDSGRILLDGIPVQGTFSPIEGSGLAYTHAQVSPGSHVVTSSEPFGLYVYGFGAAISYAYPAGFGTARPSGIENGSAPTGRLRIAPNPATTSVMVRLDVEFSRDMSIELIDPLGCVRRRMPLVRTGGGALQLELDGLPPGAYLCALRSGRTLVATEPIIIR